MEMGQGKNKLDCDTATVTAKPRRPATGRPLAKRVKPNDQTFVHSNFIDHTLLFQLHRLIDDTFQRFQVFSLIERPRR